MAEFVDEGIEYTVDLDDEDVAESWIEFCDEYEVSPGRAKTVGHLVREFVHWGLDLTPRQLERGDFPSCIAFA